VWLLCNPVYATCHKKSTNTVNYSTRLNRPSGRYIHETINNVLNTDLTSQLSWTKGLINLASMASCVCPRSTPKMTNTRHTKVMAIACPSKAPFNKTNEQYRHLRFPNTQHPSELYATSNKSTNPKYSNSANKRRRLHHASHQTLFNNNIGNNSAMHQAQSLDKNAFIGTSPTIIARQLPIQSAQIPPR
jgi:hypothetical protein